MITLLCLVLSARAGTLTDAEAGLWAAPDDPTARLAYAEALAATAGREEEGMEALRWLLASEETAAVAREVLGQIVHARPARPGWADLYALLAAGPEDDTRNAARVRAAELRLGAARTRARAIADLRALIAEGVPLAALVLGDTLLEAGDTAGARTAWLRAPDADGAARIALAALAAGDVDTARVERQRAIEAGIPDAEAFGSEFAVALTSNDPADRARALVAAGFPKAAARVLIDSLADAPAAGSPSPTDAEVRAARAASALGELRLRQGNGARAVEHLQHALALTPTPKRRAALVRALLASGRRDEAAAILTAGQVPAADRDELEITLVFARALLTPTLDDDLPAAAAAYDGAPDEIGTAATYGRLLFAAQRDAEAIAPLARASLLRPEDPEPRTQLVTAAVRAETPARGLDAAALTVEYARSPAARAAALDGLSGLLLSAADAQKVAGAPAAARTLALVALAVRPDSAAVAKTVGGLLWREHALEPALALFRRAAALDPTDTDAALSAAQLAVAVGSATEAHALLAGLSPRSPAVLALREELARAESARDAAALGITDPAAGEARWRELLVRWPDDARFLHGLADLYQSQERYTEALAIQRAAVSLAPNDPWNHLGVVHVLLALSRVREATEVLDHLPAPLPDEAARERDRIRAGLARTAGDAAHAAGDYAAALMHYNEAEALYPDVWTSLAMAGTLVASGDREGALKRFRSALDAHPDNVEVDQVATRGEAGVLEALGQGDAARVAMEGLAARYPTLQNEQLRDELVARLAVADADALRRAGHLVEAERELRMLAIEYGGQPLVDAAWGALLLDRGRAEPALEAARRALLKEPLNGWALDVARRAGMLCACSARVVPLYRVAVASGAGPEVAAELVRVQVSAALERARVLQRRHPLDARDAVREARRLAHDDAGALVILADGEKRLHHPRRSRNAYERALSLAPADADAALGLAADLVARGKWSRAVEVLDHAWNEAKDRRVGSALYALRIEPPEAWSGGAAPLTPQNGVAAAPHEEAAIEPVGPPKEGAGGPLASAGFGFYRRAGVAGVGQELATFVPIHAGPPPLGPVQLDVEAVLVRLENGADVSQGVAPSLGVSTPLGAPWAAWGRVGASPIGFESGAYPVWFAGGRGRIGAPLAFGIETGRAPVGDSYASWAGASDLFTGESYGRVHHTWVGGWAGLGAPWGTDLGLLGRLGQSQGIGLDPVGRAEAVAWLGQRFGTPERNIRIGAEAVGLSHEAQVDGFQAGQGAFYSPPVLGVATGRLDVRWTAFQDHLSVCGGVGAGMQHAGGTYTLAFAPGDAFTHSGRLSTTVRLPSGWEIGLQGGWLFAGPWHQETGTLRIGRHLGGSPPLTTFAMPASGMLYTGEPC